MRYAKCLSCTNRKYRVIGTIIPKDQQILIAKHCTLYTSCFLHFGERFLPIFLKQFPRENALQSVEHCVDALLEYSTSASSNPIDKLNQSTRVEYFRRRSTSPIQSEFIYKRISRRIESRCGEQKPDVTHMATQFSELSARERTRAFRVCTARASYASPLVDMSKRERKSPLRACLFLIRFSLNVPRASCIYTQMVNRLPFLEQYN